MVSTINHSLSTLRERYRRPASLCYDLACLFGVAMAFYGLSQTALWVDEAETAFVAKGALASGRPIAHDGVQLYPGKSWYYDEHLTWMELPWIQFYVTAFSFLIWAPDGWSARLPFIVIGLATLWPVYHVARRLFDARIARVTVLMLLYAVPYLLHIRQCRYFALLAFGTIIGIYAYLRLKDGTRWAWLLFAAAAVFLFHSHYAYFFAYMGGWVCWIALFDRPARWKPLWMATVCIFLFTFPWALYVNLFNRRGSYGGWSIWLVIGSLGYYARVLHQNIVPFLSIPLLFLLSGRSAWRRPARWAGLTLPALLVVYVLMPSRPESMVYIQDTIGGILLVLSGIWVYRQWPGAGAGYDSGRFLIVWTLGAVLALSVVLPNHAFRYLIGFMPLLSMLMACLLVRLWERSKMLGVLSGIGVAATNLFHALPFLLLALLPVDVAQLERLIFHLPPSWTFAITGGYTTDELQDRVKPMLIRMDREIDRLGTLRSPLYDYFYEITQPYRGPVEAVIAYLKAHARPGDTFASDCDAVTLAFHTGMTFRPILEDTTKAKPEWISLRPYRFYVTHSSEGIRHFYDHLLMTSYDRIELDAPDLENINYSLPDPDTHLFYPDRLPEPAMILLRRKPGLP